MRTMLLVAIFAALFYGTDTVAHEAVIVDVKNADGVISELCRGLTDSAIVIDDIDDMDAQEFYNYCVKWAVTNMVARHYPHDHS